MARNRPVLFASTAYDDLTKAVPRGEFRRYDSPSDLPSALSRVAGFPSEDEFRTTVVMSATTSGAPPTIGGITPASTAPIFRVSVIKYDQHGPDREEHLNQYDSLIFGDVEGRRWRLFAANQPKHYEVLSTDSSLAATLDKYNLPAEKQGSISILRSHGRTVDFSTGGPSSGRSG